MLVDLQAVQNRLAEFASGKRPSKRHQKALRELARDDPKTTKPRSSRPARVEREARRAERTERIGRIRDAVWAATGGTCEVKGCSRDASDLHHTIGGSQRRSRESVETCVALCQVHHRLAHEGDLEILRNLADVMGEAGCEDAQDALLRRIDRIVLARRPSP